MKDNASIAIWGVLIVALAAAVGAGVWRFTHRDAAPASGGMVFGNPIFDVPEFSFGDQEGRTVSRESLRGRIWLADFIFTSCRGPCPMMTGRMARLQTMLPDDVVFVSFSIDPTTDTPEVLREYAEGFEADPSNWHFLTGAEGEIDRVARAFHAFPAPEDMPERDPNRHVTYYFLVDGQGRMRKFYGGNDPELDLEAMASDVRRLLEE